MYKKFIQTLTWNSTTAFLYKAILLSHQVMLYSVISKTLYGMQSTLFASIYILIAVTNFGFEDTLLPFFSTFSLSKQHFLQTLYHFILRIMVVAIISIIVFNFITQADYNFLDNIRMHCDNQLMLILVLIFFIESIKRSVTAMMQLAFLTQQVALAELGMLLSYIVTIWSLYQYTGALSLQTIFMPMLVTATIELIYLSFVLSGYYNQLPTTMQTPIGIPFEIIFKQRIYNYIHQLTKTVFSPNSMTILFTSILGFEQAATIKFFINIITLGYTCISKSIGMTTGAALSAMNNASLPAIRILFSKVTKTYFNFLYIMGMIVAIVVGCSWYMATITNLMALQILLFFTIGFLEQITLTYERLFMCQRRSHFLACINLIELALFLPLIYYLVINHNQYIYSLCAAFICIKLISLATLAFLAYHFWKISL